jgi:hypothetical protein
MWQPKGTAMGLVTRADTTGMAAEINLVSGSAGGPVFAASGEAVGLTSIEHQNGRERGDPTIVPASDVCAAVGDAIRTIAGTSPPSARHLPVEPARPGAGEGPAAAGGQRADVMPYRMSAAEFDVLFITRPLIDRAEGQLEDMSGRDLHNDAGAATEEARLQLVTDFANWSEYVSDAPPVLFVRVTPKAVESFWTTVARGAAVTQGISLPPIKRVRGGLLRMQAFCGNAEVTPIHAFTLDPLVAGKDAIGDALYVFAPDALGPSCSNVKLVLYSAKEPDRADTRVVDPAVIQRVAKDF